MKYFTMAQWIADHNLDGPATASFGAVDAYQAYLHQVRDRLPGDFQRMLDTICIHDAHVHAITVDALGRRLALTLAAGDITMREPRLVCLWYDDLDEVVVPGGPIQGFGGVGFGDLGNDEIEVLNTGFEHRLLFSSGIEIQIRFGRFRLEVLEDLVNVPAT